MYNYEEKWSLNKEDILSLFPIEKIIQLLGKKITFNLMNLARTNNIRYISGYAMNDAVFDVFLGYGFKADVRSEYGKTNWLSVSVLY